MLRFSANLGFLWPDRDLLARIDAAAAAGFKAIELHWPYAIEATVVGERCRLRGLELLGINAPLGDRQGDFGLAAVPGREVEFRDSFDTALRYAEEAGASAIHVMAGLTHGGKRQECEATFRRHLDYAARSTDRMLLLEPINQRDKPGYFYSTLADATRIVAAVGAQHVKIMFNVYHLAISEGDITKTNRLTIGSTWSTPPSIRTRLATHGMRCKKKCRWRWPKTSSSRFFAATMRRHCATKDTSAVSS
jgi:hydroxypyruvate isomerase